MIELPDNRYVLAREIPGTERYGYPLNLRNWNWQEDFITMLHRLGRLTKKQLDRLRLRAEAKARKQSVEYACRELDRVINILGLQLTVGQQNKLDKLQAAVKRSVEQTGGAS